MLRFFRNIRQKLIEQENIRKYIWYALGEILLVMIGILLALQVNNWNEKKIAKQFERTLLLELKESVKNDMSFFGDHLLFDRNVFKREIHHYFEQMIRGEVVDTSYFNRNLEWLRYGNTFHVNDGAYESIKSSGIDKISNEEIRSFITKFYEFDLPRFENLLSYSLNELNDARKHDLPELLDTPSFKLEGEFEIVEQPILFDVNTNPHFIRLLEKSIQWERSSTREYERMLIMYHELDSMLTKELNINSRN